MNNATTWPEPLAWFGFLVGSAAGASVIGSIAALSAAASDRKIGRNALVLVLAALLLGFGLIRADARAWRRFGTVARSSLGLLAATSVVTALSTRGTGLPGSKFVAAIGACAAVGLAANAAPLPRRFDPAWAHPVVLQAVLVASAVTTGGGLITLLAAIRPPDTARVERLAAVLLGAIVCELIALTLLALTVRGGSGLVFQRWPGRLIPLFVVPVGLVAPLLCLQRRDRLGNADAAWLALLGGFILHAALAGIPQSLTLR